MKRISIIISIVFNLIVLKGQFTSDLVIYNPYGEPFQLYLNSNLINKYPSNKLIVTDLSAGNYQLYFVFPTSYSQPVSILISLQSGTMVSCVLSKDSQNKYFIETKTILQYTTFPVAPYNPPTNPTYPTTPTNLTNVNCSYPISDANFQTALTSIKNKSFESDKLTLAKQIVLSNCLTSRQIKEIMKTFSMEGTKLEFAKYAYKRVYDPENYYLVNDAFSFSSSISELDNYIKSLK